MNEDWIDEAERFFEFLVKGDEARRFLFTQLVAGLHLSSDSDAFDKLAKRCLKDARQRMEVGTIKKPADWITVITSVLTMAAAFDRANVLQDELQLARLRKVMTL